MLCRASSTFARPHYPSWTGITITPSTSRIEYYFPMGRRKRGKRVMAVVSSTYLPFHLEVNTTDSKHPTKQQDVFPYGIGHTFTLPRLHPIPSLYSFRESNCILLLTTRHNICLDRQSCHANSAILLSGVPIQKTTRIPCQHAEQNNRARLRPRHRNLYAEETRRHRWSVYHPPYPTPPLQYPHSPQHTHTVEKAIYRNFLPSSAQSIKVQLPGESKVLADVCIDDTGGKRGIKHQPSLIDGFYIMPGRAGTQSTMSTTHTHRDSPPVELPVTVHASLRQTKQQPVELSADEISPVTIQPVLQTPPPVLLIPQPRSPSARKMTPLLAPPPRVGMSEKRSSCGSSMTVGSQSIQIAYMPSH